MSTLIKTEIPDQLWQQAQNRVEQGGIDSMGGTECRIDAQLYRVSSTNDQRTLYL